MEGSSMSASTSLQQPTAMMKGEAAGPGSAAGTGPAGRAEEAGVFSGQVGWLLARFVQLAACLLSIE